MKEPASVNIRKLNNRSSMTVTLITTREFKIRIFIATALIKIAGLVLGCGIRVKEQSQSS